MTEIASHQRLTSGLRVIQEFLESIHTSWLIRTDLRRRVALAFDFASITDRMGAPSFAFFAKDGTRKYLRMWVISVAT
jgi:hypothetical protein